MPQNLSGRSETGKPKLTRDASKPKLLDEVRRVLRLKHYSPHGGRGLDVVLVKQAAA